MNECMTNRKVGTKGCPSRSCKKDMNRYVVPMRYNVAYEGCKVGDEH